MKRRNITKKQKYSKKSNKLTKSNKLKRTNKLKRIIRTKKTKKNKGGMGNVTSKSEKLNTNAESNLKASEINPALVNELIERLYDRENQLDDLEKKVKEIKDENIKLNNDNIKLNNEKENKIKELENKINDIENNENKLKNRINEIENSNKEYNPTTDEDINGKVIDIITKIDNELLNNDIFSNNGVFFNMRFLYSKVGYSFENMYIMSIYKLNTLFHKLEILKTKADKNIISRYLYDIILCHYNRYQEIKLKKNSIYNTDILNNNIINTMQILFRIDVDTYMNMFSDNVVNVMTKTFINYNNNNNNIRLNTHTVGFILKNLNSGYYVDNKSQMPGLDINNIKTSKNDINIIFDNLRNILSESIVYYRYRYINYFNNKLKSYDINEMTEKINNIDNSLTFKEVDNKVNKVIKNTFNTLITLINDFIYVSNYLKDKLKRERGYENIFAMNYEDQNIKYPDVLLNDEQKNIIINNFIINGLLSHSSNFYNYIYYNKKN